MKKGEVMPQEQRKKISNSKKGLIPWNKGIPRTQEEKDNISKSKIGQLCGELNPSKNLDVRNKISDSQTGSKNHMFGKHHSPETIEKIKNASPHFSGINHPNWQGGISFLPYCSKFNKELKELIRERDNKICQECGKTEIENGRKLTCHHIHYDKPNCNPDLIALCNSCNSKANKNRDYWEQHFMNNLKERNLIC